MKWIVLDKRRVEKAIIIVCVKSLIKILNSSSKDSKTFRGPPKKQTPLSIFIHIYYFLCLINDNLVTKLSYFFHRERERKLTASWRGLLLRKTFGEVGKRKENPINLLRSGQIKGSFFIFIILCFDCLFYVICSGTLPLLLLLIIILWSSHHFLMIDSPPGFLSSLFLYYVSSSHCSWFMVSVRSRYDVVVFFFLDFFFAVSLFVRSWCGSRFSKIANFTFYNQSQAGEVSF